jgi:hypothetical protein
MNGRIFIGLAKKPYSSTIFLLRKIVALAQSQKPENLCNNIYCLLFFAKKGFGLRTMRCFCFLAPTAPKNSPYYRAEAVPLQIRLAQTVFGFIRLHSSKTCIFLRPVLPYLGYCTLSQISKYFTQNKSVRLQIIWATLLNKRC